MKYFLFMDESGDHGLTTLNPDFPVFLLCGVLISETDYSVFLTQINLLKSSIWGEKIVILHSLDIRKCQKEFQILFDLSLKESFYNQLNQLISSNEYTVIASAIKKDDYIKKYGRLSNDVYELALSFIVERAIFFLDDIKTPDNQLEIIIEKRGKSEDKKLEEHFQRLIARGTGFVIAERLKNYGLQITFKSKKENINGLQLADLLAYPIARYIIEPERANPSFEIFLKKYIQNEGSDMVLKYFHKKQRAKLSFSSLPIGDTPVLIFSTSPGTLLDVSGLETPSSYYGKMSITKVRDRLIEKT